MDEWARAFWERMLAEIDDGGFFDQPHTCAPAAPPVNEPAAVRPIWTESRSGAAKQSPQPPRPPVLYAHPESWMIDVDAPETATAGLKQWQELFGPDFDRTVLLSLLPVALSMLLPLAVVVLLAVTG